MAKPPSGAPTERRRLLRIVGPRLGLALLFCLVSLGLAYVYLYPLNDNSRVIVAVLFFIFVSTWPCLIVSAIFRLIVGLRGQR